MRGKRGTHVANRTRFLVQESNFRLGSRTAPLALPTPQLSGVLAEAFFILLFPMFFFYHYGVAVGLFPRYLAGWFGAVSLVAATLLGPLLVIAVAKGLPRASFSLTMVFLILLAYTTVIAVANWFLGDPVVRMEAIRQYAAMAAGWVALFGVGFYMPSHGALMKWNRYLLYAMALIAWRHVDSERMIFYAAQDLLISDGVASYQGFARSFALTAMFVIANETRMLNQTVGAVVSVATLFILGARSEWAGFVVVASIWFVWTCKQRGWRFTFSALLLLIILLVLALQIPSLSASRQLELFNLAESTSWQGRVEFLVRGLADISEHPIFGDFGGHIRSSGVGGYIHNILSAWHAFGLLGFALYTGLCVTPVIIMVYIVFLRGWRSSLAKFAFNVALFSLILVVVAKPIYWQVPALGWGLVAGILRNSAHRRAR